MQWYHRIFREPDEGNQLALILQACAAYELEYPAALLELKPPAGRIEATLTRIAGLTAENYSRLQDLEIMLEHIQNIEDRVRINKTRYYKEQYQREINDSLAMKYADGHEDVQDMRKLRYRVSSVRNMFHSISKGLEVLHYQIGHLVKLRAVGLDDATF